MWLQFCLSHLGNSPRCETWSLIWVRTGYKHSHSQDHSWGNLGRERTVGFQSEGITLLGRQEGHTLAACPGRTLIVDRQQIIANTGESLGEWKLPERLMAWAGTSKFSLTLAFPLAPGDTLNLSSPAHSPVFHPLALHHMMPSLYPLSACLLPPSLEIKLQFISTVRSSMAILYQHYLHYL